MNDENNFKVGDRVIFRMFKQNYYGIVCSVGDDTACVRAATLTAAEFAALGSDAERCDYGARHHEAITESVHIKYMRLVARAT